MSDAAPAAGAAASASEGPSNKSNDTTPAAGTKTEARNGDRSRAGDKKATGAVSEQREPLPGRPGDKSPERQPQKKPEPAQKKPDERQAKAPDEDAGKDPFEAFRKAKHKVPVDGQEVEVDFDELVRGYSHNQAANKRMAEAAELRKKADGDAAALHAAKTGDFRPLVEAVGLEKAEAFAVDLIEQLSQWEALSPEDRENQRIRREHADYKKRDAEKAEAEKKEAAAQRASQAEANLDRDVTEVLKASGKKATPLLVAQIAEQMLADHMSRKAKQARGELVDQSPLGVKGAYEKVSREMKHQIAEFLSDMPAADLRKLLPKSVLDALRNSDLEEAQALDPFGSGRRPPPSEPKPQREHATKKMTTEEWLAAKEAKFKQPARR